MPGHKVLVVDDDRDTLALYSTALALSGFEVVAAENGVQALRLVDREVPDAVVTDLAMPGMDGVAFCRHLRSNPAARQVPVLAVSGQLSPTLTCDARRAGCDEVLTKPCLPDELIETVGRLIDTGPAGPERYMSACSRDRDTPASPGRDAGTGPASTEGDSTAASRDSHAERAPRLREAPPWAREGEPAGRAERPAPEPSASRMGPGRRGPRRPPIDGA